MMKIIDDFLNNITMYRLMLYFLVVLLLNALVLSFFHLMPFEPLSLIFSVSFLIAVSQLTNKVFAVVFRVPTNLESVYISALILAAILTPTTNIHALPLLFWAAVWASASKFIIAINKKHLFNPAALAVFLTALALNQSASWWIGTLYLIPATLIGGLLVVQKIRRWDLVLIFLAVSTATILSLSLFKGTDIYLLVKQIFADSPILFFAFVMLTEPQTTPPTKTLRLFYGVIVGFLFSPQIHFGALATTPEMALVLGNVYSFLVSPKQKFIMTFKQKIQLGKDIYDFIFNVDQKINFIPGQYLEWTLAVPNSDSRGNRRYFTLASSPTESDVKIGIRFSENSSAFKKRLLALNPLETLLAGSLAGEFTLPDDPGKKLAFVAGGIGITPFRSMIKYLLDTNSKRDIVLFYGVKDQQDIVYKDVFDLAQKQLGIKIIYQVGVVDQQLIQKEMADFKDRLFYLSGPHAMVTAVKNTLLKMGIFKKQIKTDYFPGY